MAVMPRGAPARSIAVTTVTPVRKVPSALRNRRDSRRSSIPGLAIDQFEE